MILKTTKFDERYILFIELASKDLKILAIFFSVFRYENPFI